MLIVTTLLYLVGWTAIPCFDKAALANAQQHALTWAVFFLAFLFLSTYVLVFTENPRETIGIAMHQAPIWGSAGCTVMVYIVYFRLLNAQSMLYVVMLQPILLVSQTVAGVLIMKESVDRWNLVGIAITVMGMAIYNFTFIKTHVFPSYAPISTV